MVTAKQRGWIPVALPYPLYLRLDKRLLNKKEPWGKCIGRVLDQLDAYEAKFGKLPESPEVQ